MSLHMTLTVNFKTKTKTNTKTKTTTKFLKVPTCAIFLKSLGFKDIIYDTHASSAHRQTRPDNVFETAVSTKPVNNRMHLQKHSACTPHKKLLTTDVSFPPKQPKCWPKSSQQGH